MKQLSLKLAAEMDRLRTCNTANEVLNFMRSQRSAAEIAAAEKALLSLTIYVEGKLARFERIAFYMNVSGYDEKDENGAKNSQISTATFADEFIGELTRGEGNDAQAYARWKTADSDSRSHIQFDLEYKVSRAVNLVGMRHLQYAGAPKKDDFLITGCEAAIGLFTILGSKGFRKLYTDDIQRFADGLLLAALAGRWDDFKTLCDLVPPRLAIVMPKDFDELTIQHTNAMLSFASDFRQVKMPGVNRMEQVVLLGRPQRPKQLFTIWQAVRENDAAAFCKALKSSITSFSRRKRDLGFYNMPRNPLAVEESVICLAAKQRGMKIPALDEAVADYLVTNDSIRYCNHD